MKNCRSPYLRGKGGSINWSKEFTQYISLQSIVYICKPCSCDLHFCHKHFGNTVEKHQSTQSASQPAQFAALCLSQGQSLGPSTKPPAWQGGLWRIFLLTPYTPQLPPLWGTSSCCDNFLQNQKNFLRISLSFPGPAYALPFWKRTTKQMLIKITNLSDEQHI